MSSSAVQTVSTLLTEEEKAELQSYDFPFENLAFEGGGSKGMAYVGVVRVSSVAQFWHVGKIALLRS